MSLEKLKKALEGKELDFNLDDLHIMPTSEFNTLVEDYKGEVESTKIKSQKIGQEILLKELKNDLGFDYEGRKDPENLKKAYIDKFGASESKDEDVEALRNAFSKQLQDKESEIESIRTSFKKDADDRIIDESLRSSFSTFKDKSHYTIDDLVTLAKSKGEFSVVDGKAFQSKNGEVIKNDMLQVVTVDSYANSMMNDSGYIKKATGGKLVGDETKGGKYTLEQFYASQESQGISLNGEEAAINLDAAIRDGKIEM